MYGYLMIKVQGIYSSYYLSVPEFKSPVTSYRYESFMTVRTMIQVSLSLSLRVRKRQDSRGNSIMIMQKISEVKF